MDSDRELDILNGAKLDFLFNQNFHSKNRNRVENDIGHFVMVIKITMLYLAVLPKLFFMYLALLTFTFYKLLAFKVKKKWFSSRRAYLKKVRFENNSFEIFN